MIRIILIIFLLFQNYAFANDTLQFVFPNSGWHELFCGSIIKDAKCFVPYKQNIKNYREMLIFSKFTNKNNAFEVLKEHIENDLNKYSDIVSKYVENKENNAYVMWCSEIKNVCAVERTFKVKDGVILVSYINKSPHYSNSMFGRWINILSTVKVHDGVSIKNKIELN